MRRIKIITAIMLCIGFLFSCNYEEGDQQAHDSFKKMTIQEKTLYDGVSKEWSQRYLTSVRRAVYNRELKPTEKTIPFIDIANVIKTNNQVSLKLNESWSTSNKNKSIKARWDQIDHIWYRKILNSIGINKYNPQELIPEEELIVAEKSKPIFKEVIIKNSIPVKDTSDLVMFDTYDDLYYEIKKCPEAIELYNEIIEERILTKDDLKQLMIVSLGCKSRSIKDKLNK